MNKIFLVLAILILAASGCSTTEQPKIDGNNPGGCAEGMESVYAGNNEWRCEALRDIYVEMTAKELASKSPTNSNSIFKAHAADSKAATDLLVQREATTGAIYLKLVTPFQVKWSVGEKVTGAFLQKDGTTLSLTSFPSYYTKEPANGSYMRCLINSSSESLLALHKCKFIKVTN